MKTCGHLDSEQLILAIDDELTGAGRLAVEAHLSHCIECNARYRELAVLSVRVESLMGSIPANASPAMRDTLKQQIANLDPRPRSPFVSWRVGWGMAVAATLALGLVFLPRHHATDGLTGGAMAVGAISPGTFEIDGETFVSLPFSNSDLPLSTPRIVRMQMPLSSLADAGLVFEPISNEAARPDRSVLADVLLGADGEPLGVHVVASE